MHQTEGTALGLHLRQRRSGSRRTGVAVARHWREVLLALARAGAAATLCTLGLQTARMAAIAGGGRLDGTVLQRSTAKSGPMVLHISPRCDTCGTAFPPGAVRSGLLWPATLVLMSLDGA